MTIKIEPRDYSALIVSLRDTLKFWLRSRNSSPDPQIRGYYRGEARAVIRILRATKGAQ